MGNAQAAPLFDAIAEGDVDAAVKVLEAHPGLSHKRAGKKNRTVYHACASGGQIAVLRRLCEHVWHTVPDELGKTHPDAIPEGRSHPVIYRAVNSYDESGLTPLMLACKKGHAGTAQYLLSQGADPWLGDRLLGRSALHHAARANYPECIEAILSSPFVETSGKVRSKECRLVDYPSNSGYTPLHYAASTRSSDAAIALFRHGANPNAKNWDIGFDFIQLERGSTPLHAAARYQNLDMAMVLLAYWDDNLRRQDVTDPRVVENYERIKPYQVIGVRQNKAMSRVLDPSTPIGQISDPFGGKQQAAAHGQLSKVAPLMVYQRRSPPDAQVPAVVKVAGASGARSDSPAEAPPSGWEDVLSGKSVAVSSMGDFVTVYRCAEFAADYDSVPLPPPGSTKGGGAGGGGGQRGGLLRTQSDCRRGTQGQAANTPAGLARTRSGAVPASSYGMFGRNGSSSSSDEDTIAAAQKRTGQLSAIRDAPSAETSKTGVASPVKSPSSPTPAPGSLVAAKVMPSPFSNFGGPVLQPVTPPRGELAVSAGLLKTAQSVERDVAAAAAVASNMSSPAGTKPPSPDGAKAINARSITRSLSKKLSGAFASGGHDAAAAAAPNPPPSRAPTVNRGSSPPGGSSGEGVSGGPPQAFSAWGDGNARASSGPAVHQGGKAAAGAPGPSKQRDGTPDFTRDSHAADAQPVEVTMYPHTRVNLEQLKAGDTCNTVEAERAARRRSSGEHHREHPRGSSGMHRHQPNLAGGSDAGGHCRGSGSSGSNEAASSSGSSRWSVEAKAKTNPAFNVSRQGLLPANELSEDESKPEGGGRAALPLSPTGSRVRVGPHIGPL